MFSAARQSRLLKALVVGVLGIAGGVGNGPGAPAAATAEAATPRAPATAELTSLLEPPSPLVASNPRWSPDGRAITFYAETDGQTDVYVQRLGEAPRRLTGASAFDYGPDFSPDGEWIVFYSGAERNFEINLMRRDGSARRALTATGGYEGNPSFSPDGERIVFTSNRDGNHEVYVMDADGSDPVRLTRNEANDWTPRFSPDGRRIVFASDRGGDFSIWTMAADGSDVTPVADVNVHDYYPDWSPDGERIAFFSGPDPDSFQVWVADLPGGTTAQITAPPITATSPAWSPDGARLLIGATRDGQETLMTVRPDGSDLQPLSSQRPHVDGAARQDRAPTPITDAGPSWSPDGSLIAFFSDRDGSRDIYVMAPDGSGVRQLTDTDAQSKNPQWSPDGRRIIFYEQTDTNADVYTVDVDGGPMHRITNTTWRAFNPAFSPDGERVIYFSMGEQAGLYMLNADGSDHRTVMSGAYYAPSFSPDGTKILYSANVDGSLDVFLRDVTGGEPLRLTDSPARDTGASFSADGSRIAFASDRDGNDEIYVINADGSGLTRVTHSAGNDVHPSFSPDGARLVFHSDRDGNFEIYVIGVDGSGLRRLTGGAEGTGPPAASVVAPGSERRLTDWPGTEDSPRFSPDGEWLAFHANDGGPSDLYLMRLADGEVRRLTTSPHDDRRPVWSPDGLTLAYQSTVDGVTGIWTIPATGGTPTPVLHRAGITAIAPDFGPDGRLVATVLEPDPTRDYGHVTPWLMDADGGNARSLTTEGDEWYARWDAAGEWLYYYDGSGDSMAAVNAASGKIRDVTRGRFVGWRPMPSPDGRALAFVTSPGWTVTLSDVDGDTVPRSLTTVGRDDFPSFSPDGRHVVFSSDRAPSRIVELDLASGARRELATGTDPELLADGRLAYLSDTKPAELRILDPGAGAETRVDLGKRIPYRVAHSPSGRRRALVIIAGPALPALSLQVDLGDGGGLRTVIDDRVESPHWCGSEDALLVSYDPAESFRQIFLLEPDTGARTQLTASPGSKVITACADDRSWISYRYTSGGTGTGVLDATPEGWKVRFETDGRDGALSPDGRTFAEVRSESGRTDLFLRAADGSLTRLTDDDLVESTPRWSRDGSRLVFAARASQRDLWMIDLDPASGPSSGPPAGQRAAPSYARTPDISGCDNCKDFPAAWLHEDPADLLDLAALAPERRLDFLVGEWELLFPYTNEQEGIHYTTDLPIGYEIIDWLVPQKVIQAYQEWPFTSGGGIPFRARSDFRYIADDQRWQMLWMTNSATSVFTGGLEPDGSFVLREYFLRGRADALRLETGMLYVFRNITRDRFLAEAYLSNDGGRTYDQLDWRLRYRRRR